MLGICHSLRQGALVAKQATIDPQGQPAAITRSSTSDFHYRRFHNVLQIQELRRVDIDP